MVFDTCTRDKPDELLLLTVVAAEALATLLLDTTIPRLRPRIGSGNAFSFSSTGTGQQGAGSSARAQESQFFWGQPGDGGVQKQRG